VKGVSDLRDEYDSCIGGIYALVSGGRPPIEIAQYLSSVEKQAIGFSTNLSKLMDIAERLDTIDVRLNLDDVT
jgi:hypothetical protein